MLLEHTIPYTAKFGLDDEATRFVVTTPERAESANEKPDDVMVPAEQE